MASFFSVFYGALSFLALAAAVTALIISILARKKYPKRASYAMVGFGLFAFSGLIALVWPPIIGVVLNGPETFGTYRALSVVNSVLQTVLQIGAVAMLVLALFKSDEAPQASSPGQYAPQQQQQYPAQQYQQPYPQQQQYPAQPQQPYGYQQQPPPGQQYPGQGGQQYPPQGY